MELYKRTIQKLPKDSYFNSLNNLQSILYVPMFP